MLGMMQIVIYMLAAYMILKGVEILQIGQASTHESRGKLITRGIVTLVICVVMAIGFVIWGDMQASASSPGG